MGNKSKENARNIQQLLTDLDKKVLKQLKSSGTGFYSKAEFSKLIEDLNILEIEHRRTKNFWNFLANLKIEKQFKSIRDNLNQLHNFRSTQNLTYFKRKKEEISSDVFKHGSRVLDEYQSAPVMVDEHNVLVIAGAGTGKTSTIVGRLKYLLIEKKVDPKSILALTYTNASSEDMKKRIKKETGVDLDVFTFHKIGKDIITQVEGKVPQIRNEPLFDSVRGIVKTLVENKHDFQIQLFDYLNYHRYLERTQFDFKSAQEYEQFKRLNPYITLKGETVKSGEEVLIANFLFVNQIDYVYEKKYIVETNSREFGQYYPDFYLPTYDLWIEHFALDRQSDVPPFFSGGHGKSARQLYLDGIDWKRDLHKLNQTHLIETYSYEVFEGTILGSLKTKLEAYSVVLKPLSEEALFSALDSQRSLLDGLIEVFSTVISHVRNQNLTNQRFLSIPMDPSSSKLREMIVTVLDHYTNMLYDSREIDFSDMLNRAIDYLDAGKFSSPYDFVIVDEFQDMTDLTYRFLNSLRKVRDYQLMCVGDDWQSIYRFAGSNLEYVIDFEKHFGITEQFVIRNTYRFNQSIAEISGSFIQQNPRQIKKDLRSASNVGVYGVGILEGSSDWVCVAQLADKLSEIPSGKSVLLLGRYRNDIDILKHNKQFSYKYNQAKKCIEVAYEKKDLEISFRTVHGSKGLEADYVFIVNTKRGSYGFPSQIQDLRILEYLLKGQDSYKFSEERRLFYVALTRARRKVWLLVNENDKSEFVRELQSMFSEEFKKEKYACPVCEGHLRQKDGKYGKFIGCSNYPSCTYSRKLYQKSAAT